MNLDSHSSRLQLTGDALLTRARARVCVYAQAQQQPDTLVVAVV